MVFVRNSVNSVFYFSNAPVLFPVYYDFDFPVELMITSNYALQFRFLQVGHALLNADQTIFLDSSM